MTPPEAPAVQPTLHVLLVEDNLDHASLAKRGLSSNRGFHVTHVRTGAAALEEASRTEFDACVLDYRLPDWEGVKLIRELRDAGRSFPIFLVTAVRNEGVVKRAFAAGVENYVVKEGRYGDRLAEEILDRVGGNDK